jgi:hypothetical protein
MDNAEITESDPKVVSLLLWWSMDVFAHYCSVAYT